MGLNCEKYDLFFFQKWGPKIRRGLFPSKLSNYNIGKYKLFTFLRKNILIYLRFISAKLNLNIYLI